MGTDTNRFDERLERILFDQATIRSCIAEMGAKITADYAGGDLTIVAVLQGGVLFLADLIREIRLPLRMDSISVASYHGGTTSSGTVTFHQNRLPEVEGRDVIVLDDILDSGRTLSAIMARIEAECHPRSLRSAVLRKHLLESRRSSARTAPTCPKALAPINLTFSCHSSAEARNKLGPFGNRLDRIVS